MTTDAGEDVRRFDDVAREAVNRALNRVSGAKQDGIREDLEAGETLTALIEVLELVPEHVDPAVIELLAAELGKLPDGPHRRIGNRAVERAREVYS